MAFKPGDRVIYAGRPEERIRQVGVVKEIDFISILVDWGRGFDGHLGGGTAGYGPGTHWWENDFDLRPAKDHYIKKFKEAYGKQTNPS